MFGTLLGHANGDSCRTTPIVVLGTITPPEGDHVHALNDLLVALNDLLWTFLVVPLLVAPALYFTVRSGLVQFRLLPEMFRTLSGSPGAAPDGGREISSFQAFALSTASRVGVGSILGMTLAIMWGGPGAVFWMWVMAGLLGAVSFAESTLAQLYKVRTSTGFRGGPAYYLLYGIGQRWMAVLFAVLVTVGFSLFFNTVQANSVSVSIGTSVDAVGGPTGWWLSALVGLGLAALTAAVVFGGVRRVAYTVQGLVPVMTALYVLLGVFVILLNIGEVPRVLADVFGHAFGLREAAAGGAGTAVLWGVRSGVVSGQAGLGSAPNAGAAASVSHPVKQGLVQTLGGYFDAWLVCSITAFVVLLYGTEFPPDGEAITVAQTALETSLGEWSIHALTVILFLLAWSSILGNYYYGEANLRFLDASRKHMGYFRWAVLAALLVGSLVPLTTLWYLALLSLGVMAIINMIALVPLSEVVFRLLRDYSRQLRNGLDPQFTLAKMPDLEKVTAWGPASGHLPDDLARGEGPAPGDPAAETDEEAWQEQEEEITSGPDGAEGRAQDEGPEKGPTEG